MSTVAAAAELITTVASPSAPSATAIPVAAPLRLLHCGRAHCDEWTVMTLSHSLETPLVPSQPEVQPVCIATPLVGHSSSAIADASDSRVERCSILTACRPTAAAACY